MFPQNIPRRALGVNFFGFRDCGFKGSLAAAYATACPVSCGCWNWISWEAPLHHQQGRRTSKVRIGPVRPPSVSGEEVRWLKFFVPICSTCSFFPGFSLFVLITIQSYPPPPSGWTSLLWPFYHCMRSVHLFSHLVEITVYFYLFIYYLFTLFYVFLCFLVFSTCPWKGDSNVKLSHSEILLLRGVDFSQSRSAKCFFSDKGQRLTELLHGSSRPYSFMFRGSPVDHAGLRGIDWSLQGLPGNVIVPIEHQPKCTGWKVQCLSSCMDSC